MPRAFRRWSPARNNASASLARLCNPLLREHAGMRGNPRLACLKGRPQARGTLGGVEANPARFKSIPCPPRYSAASSRAGAAPSAASQRSASSAAMQPMPAEVTAWRKIGSAMSPAAKTPGTPVAVEPGTVFT